MQKKPNCDEVMDALEQLKGLIDTVAVKLAGCLGTESNPPPPSGGSQPPGDPQPPTGRQPPTSPQPPAQPPSTPNPALRIAGLEYTQAVQYFRFNNQGSGYAPDNSVPLVANKPLILRVYVDRRGSAGGTITGKVSYAPSGGDSRDLAPLNGPIPGRPASQIDRGKAKDTLNFRVPPEHCVGSVTFTVSIFDPANTADFGTPANVTLRFERVAEMRIHALLVRYRGGSAPSQSDLIKSLAWTARTYPIPGIKYTGIEVLNFDGSGPGGCCCCGQGWNQLMCILKRKRAASGTRDVYVALMLPRALGPGTIGCGGNGVAAAYVGYDSTWAQEIGHSFGRRHAPCGRVNNPDRNYPRYGNYPSASIGEYGFDSQTLSVHSPVRTRDFMSYCRPAWISPYTYVGLKNAMGAHRAVGRPDEVEAGGDAKGEYLYLSFAVDRAGGVHLHPSFQLNGPTPEEEHGESTSIACELLHRDGEEEEALAFHRCHLESPLQDAEASSLTFFEALPWGDQANRINFLRGGEVISTVDVADERLEVTDLTVTSNDDDQQARVTWKVGGASLGKVYSLLRFSTDEGRTWRVIGTDLKEMEKEVDLASLPGGEKCVFQVASYGFVGDKILRTAIATSDPFSRPVTPRLPFIIAPRPNQTFPEGAPILLVGGGFSPSVGSPDFDEILWTSRTGEVLGTGSEVLLPKLPVGRHKIRMDIADGLDGEASATVVIDVIDGNDNL